MKINKNKFSLVCLTLLFFSSQSAIAADSLVDTNRKISISSKDVNSKKVFVKKTIDIKNSENTEIKQVKQESILVIEAKKRANAKSRVKNDDLSNPLVIKKTKPKQNPIKVIDPKDLDSQIKISSEVNATNSNNINFKTRRIEATKKDKESIRQFSKYEINKKYNYKPIKIDSKDLDIRRRSVERENNAKIMGESKLTKSQFVQYLKSTGTKPKLTCSIEEIVELYLKEGAEEGIRGDLALCQALLETGNFTYGGLVTPEQNNFCGLGSTGKGFKGASFATAAEGVEAHLQHLMAYATPRAPRKKIIDPRYYLVHNMRKNSGFLPEWKDLNNKWAARGNYSDLIFNIYNKVNSIVSLDVNDYLKEDKKTKAVTKKDLNSKNEKTVKTKKSTFRERIDKILAARKKAIEK